MSRRAALALAIIGLLIPASVGMTLTLAQVTKVHRPAFRQPVCGNGLVESGEQCDRGRLNGQVDCGRNCRSLVCGDGVLSPKLGEECDDGNLTMGDGCGRLCNLEDDLIEEDIFPFVNAHNVELKPDEFCNYFSDGCQRYSIAYRHIDQHENTFYGLVEIEFHPNLISNEQFENELLPEGDVGSLFFVKQYENEKAYYMWESIYTTDRKYHNRTYIWYSDHRTIKVQFGNIPDGADLKEAEQLVWAYMDKHGSDLRPPAPSCGNWIVDAIAGEECDDGNLQIGDGCDRLCKVEDDLIETDIEHYRYIQPGFDTRCDYFDDQDCQRYYAFYKHEEADDQTLRASATIEYHADAISDEQFAAELNLVGSDIAPNEFSGLNEYNGNRYYVWGASPFSPELFRNFRTYIWYKGNRVIRVQFHQTPEGFRSTQDFDDLFHAYMDKFGSDLRKTGACDEQIVW